MTNKRKFIIAITSALAVLLAVSTFFIVKQTKDKPKKETSTSISSSNSSSSSKENEEPEIVPTLNITSPDKEKVNTTDKNFTFTGSCNKDFPLTVNGKDLQFDENGNFSYEVTLNVGNNTFTFENNGIKKTYTINYRYVIINGYSPSTKQSYIGGSTFYVTVLARKGSTVTATFSGSTITLTKVADEQNTTDFINFTGSFTLPSDKLKNTNMGKVKFTATHNGKSESFSSGDITCKKASIIVDYDANATPLGGRYINVGSGKITEITTDSAQTFDAYSTNDWSKPTNNYLPKGTVDYSAQGYVYHSRTDGRRADEYAVLRCGYQVYTSVYDVPGYTSTKAVKEYAGTLPETNTISFANLNQEGSHTVLTFDTDWKAPFYFNLAPQKYNNEAYRDYTFSTATYSYVDITFCYSSAINNEIVIPSDNPIFSSAQVIKNASDYTLRLYLKRQGKFFGWTCHYNEKGQLVFEFLNPAQTKDADNAYGIDLTGTKILIDVGHGGADCGAVGFNKTNTEAERNLNLAKKLKAQLESIGATVYLTRDDNSTSTNNTKVAMLAKLKPDFCIAIHHDSNTKSSLNGFGAYHFNAFSKNATDYIYQYTVAENIYRDAKVKWHYYYMARSTVCPVVLTENGYMSNRQDFNGITNEEINNRKAAALTKGIVEYFKSIRL